MTNDYQSLIHLNPVIPYQLHGFRSSHWCNMLTIMDGQTKQFHISVFANTPQQATFYASQLQQYIEMNPMKNHIGGVDDISIGVRSPIFDTVSQGYIATMIVNTGMLQFINTRIAPVKPYAIPKAKAGTDVTTEKLQVVDLNGSKSSAYDYGALTYLWSFSSVPSGSTAVLNDPTSSRPSFTPDVEGNYGIILVVNDGTSDSNPDMVVVTATKITALVMHDADEVWHDSDQVINTY